MSFTVDTSMVKIYLGPLDDMVNVLLAVWQVLAYGLLVAVQHAGLRCLAGLQRHRPRAMLNASSDVVGAGVSVGSGEVHVKCASRAVVSIEWVHACDLTGVRVHTPCSLTRLDVTPNYTKLVVLMIVAGNNLPMGAMSLLSFMKPASKSGAS